MHSSASAGLAVIAVLLLAACAPQQELFVVLPNANGSSGAISVSDGHQTALLDRPFAAAEMRQGAADRVAVDPNVTRVMFNGAMQARPILPAHFRLYFVLDSDRLTPESAAAYRAVFDDIRRRPVYQVEVVGYTDTLGDQAYNQTLSMARAAAIRAQLGTDGLNPRDVAIAGRGKLDQLVPTGDQVAEPRNRRVEITVR